MKIVILDGYTENPGDLSWEPLKKLGETTIYDRTALDNEDEVIKRIGDAEMVYTNKTPISKKVIDACPNMKFISMLATGYNGAPQKLKHCGEIGCLRETMGIPSGERHELCRGLHAEQNAIIQAALHGVAIEGAILYCTHHPCSVCTKMLINAGISRIVYLDGYPDELSAALLTEAQVPTEQAVKQEE